MSGRPIKRTLRGRCQRRTPVPELWRPDETECRVRRHSHCVVEVFVAREPGDCIRRVAE